MSAKPDELLKASFEAQLKSIEAKFAAQFDAQNAIIEEFKKERVETKITHDLEDLIKGGHVAPANRELLKSLFMAMDSAQKVNFSIGEKVVEDASTLLKHLLKSYSVWQSDASTTSADIDTEMADALPETDEEVTVKYRGVELPLDNAKENDMAKDLQKKYALAGKTVKFWDCYLEVIKNRK
jgi:small-conductance mechanosensitive channel